MKVDLVAAIPVAVSPLAVTDLITLTSPIVSLFFEAALPMSMPVIVKGV